eukprot:gnl/TRDRNA2_/TRDRNA2_175300_c0_seq1.p1 gnl/TRDRNA2_/TRDRNA2_175300_c0~~gnl/TRDRNA2_/TRDRNA2_175300_c0_seq1.p1  ORF type:complete len:214 (+),score=43.68 gnl/TRDRNA2_/TRDRNA2_175300_c0_seq1:73-714(+)
MRRRPMIGAAPILLLALLVCGVAGDEGCDRDDSMCTGDVSVATKGSAMLQVNRAARADSIAGTNSSQVSEDLTEDEAADRASKTEEEAASASRNPPAITKADAEKRLGDLEDRIGKLSGAVQQIIDTPPAPPPPPPPPPGGIDSYKSKPGKFSGNNVNYFNGGNCPAGFSGTSARWGCRIKKYQGNLQEIKTSAIKACDDLGSSCVGISVGKC